MADIVTQLRRLAGADLRNVGNWASAAADEIERLRSAGMRATEHIRELETVLADAEKLIASLQPPPAERAGAEQAVDDEPCVECGWIECRCADQPDCAACRGTGRNPLSDNVNWLPCGACNGSGKQPASAGQHRGERKG